MSAKLDMVIIGAGPGGIAAGLIAARSPKSCLILEKGRHVMQGIVETYPKGKKVYPTLPRNHTEPFPVMEL
ncbi:MAG: NAD(P)-binding domain-containing protein, partial [Desulfatirhabdiaceae bacterium]